MPISQVVNYDLAKPLAKLRVQATDVPSGENENPLRMPRRLMTVSEIPHFRLEPSGADIQSSFAVRPSESSSLTMIPIRWPSGRQATANPWGKISFRESTDGWHAVDTSLSRLGVWARVKDCIR